MGSFLKKGTSIKDIKVKGIKFPIISLSGSNASIIGTSLVFVPISFS